MNRGKTGKFLTEEKKTVSVVLEIEHLSFKYPDGHQALRDINLVVNQGESVGLIGPNGAGKSTLLLHLNGIIQSNGSVKVMGMTAKGNNLKNIRSKIGLVFQDPNDQLFSPTVFDDVAFGPLNMGLSPDEVRQRVDQALGSVGMTDYEQRSSHHLSIGEKKRIAIATVLSMSAEILVLDEPTSNLDYRSKRSLIKLLKHLPMTKIIATHDLNVVKTLCQRTILLNEGHVIFDGPTEVILADAPLLEAHGIASTT